MTGQVQEKTTKPIQLYRGVRPVYVESPKLLISPKLFTTALKDVFKTLDRNGRGINVNSQYFSHPRFADDIVIPSKSLHDLEQMLNKLDDGIKEFFLFRNIILTADFNIDIMVSSTDTRAED